MAIKDNNDSTFSNKKLVTKETGGESGNKEEWRIDGRETEVSLKEVRW